MDIELFDVQTGFGGAEPGNLVLAEPAGRSPRAGGSKTVRRAASARTKSRT